MRNFNLKQSFRWLMLLLGVILGSEKLVAQESITKTYDLPEYWYESWYNPSNPTYPLVGKKTDPEQQFLGEQDSYGAIRFTVDDILMNSVIEDAYIDFDDASWDLFGCYRIRYDSNSSVYQNILNGISSRFEATSSKNSLTTDDVDYYEDGSFFGELLISKTPCT